MARKLIAIAIALGALVAPLPAGAPQNSPRFGDLVKAPADVSAPQAAAFGHQVWALQYRERAYEAHHWSEGEDAGAGSNTTLAIDPTGVKLSSPVLGVIILVVSMGFFYLYLKTVYPIQEMSGAEPAATQAAPNPPAKQ